MCCPFSTGMERAKSITELRDGGVFPVGFEEKCPREAQVIRWLLQCNPIDRPTAAEIVYSQLVPAKLEDELLKSALTQITTPGTTIFSVLMEKLFSISPDRHLRYLYETSDSVRYLLLSYLTQLGISS